MDFSNYKIYAGDDGCSGHLLAPDKEIDLTLLEKEFIYSFDEGIKKLQEEKRGLYLYDVGSRKMTKYFKEKYGIFAT